MTVAGGALTGLVVFCMVACTTPESDWATLPDSPMSATGPEIATRETPADVGYDLTARVDEPEAQGVEPDPIAAYFRAHPERKEFSRAVLSHRVVKGMVEEEVHLAIGSPARINRWADREQWVYARIKVYVFLNNSVVTSVERLE